jgi:hypothetical protein
MSTPDSGTTSSPDAQGISAIKAKGPDIVRPFFIHQSKTDSVSDLIVVRIQQPMHRHQMRKADDVVDLQLFH